MGMYYLDIETTGFNQEKDKIITIQYQRLDDLNNGKPIGELIILKEWESSEEQIVKQFFDIFMADTWNFIPVMQNHLFDFKFLFAKFKKYCNWNENELEFMFGKPVIDIKYTLVMANNLSFKNAGLDKLTNKKFDGRVIPAFYENKEYDRIINYIIEESECFINSFQKIVNILKEEKEKFK